MTTPEYDPVLAPELDDATDVEDGGSADGGSAGADPADERPATSDPEQMVRTPDELGGTGADAGGAG